MLKKFSLLIVTFFQVFSSYYVYAAESTKEEFGGFELYLHTAGEIYFFDVWGDRQQKELDRDDGSKVTWDYSGRKYKLQYEFSPVYLASFEGYAKWSFLKFDGIYKTNRFIKGGGTIEHDSEVISKLSDNKEFSEIIKVGITIFDLHTSYRSVLFNFGSVDVVDVSSGQVVATSTMQLKIDEIDVDYRFLNKWGLFAGYKYMSYSLPRIIYQMEDTNGSDNDDYVYVAETKPQDVLTESHLLGVGTEPLIRFSHNGFGLIMGGAFYIGGGKTSFVFDSDNADTQPKKKSSTLISMLPKFNIGLSYHYLDTIFKSSVRLVYEGNVVAYFATDDFVESGNDKGSTRYDFNSGDYYHNVSFAVDFLF